MSTPINHITRMGLTETNKAEIAEAQQRVSIRKRATVAVAKALAHKQCGNEEHATMWASELIKLLREAGIEVKT